jgi:outer membrane protein assembly factor BamB
MTHNDRDALLRIALSPAPHVVAPADLGDAIYSEVLATPQRRALLPLGGLGPIPAPSPVLLTLALLALLTAVVIVAGLFRPPSEPILSMHHGGPDRTGVMPGPGPAGRPVEVWNVGRNGAIPHTSMPLPAAGLVLVADTGGEIAALDAATGSERWVLAVGAGVYGTPALAGELVVAGTDAGELVAIDIATGDQAWRRSLDGGPVVAPPLVADDLVLAATEGGRLVAVAPEDGAIQWSIDVGAAVIRGPAYANGVVYVGTQDGWLIAIDVAGRAVRWRQQLGPGAAGSPAVADGRVYVGWGGEVPDPQQRLVALDAAEGRLLWTFGTPGGERAHLGAVAHGRVYAAAEDGVLYALDARSGALAWNAELGGRLATLATVVGDVVYASSTEGTIHALDARTGAVIWSVEVDVGEPTMPVVVGGRLFVGTNLGRVVAFADPPAP